MPLDHFISQVHLKNFYTNDERGRLVAIRKDDLKKFYPRSEDVCRREHGSTNKYLSEPRAVEMFLKNVEPNYNISVEAIRQKAPGTKDVYVIAGFIAYIMACSPTGMRITRGPIAAAVQSTAEILDAQGRFPPAPTAFGGKSMTELLSDGLVQLKIDDKYPQAIGISAVEAWTYVLGNASWDVIFADPAYGTFFTSDFPIAFGQSYDARVVSKTVPLAPDIAICIHPQVRERKAQSDFSFPNFRARFRRLSRAELHETNQNLVRSAETLVFYNQNADWLMSFVRKNRDYRADAVVSMNPTTTGKMIIARQAVVPFGRPKLS